LVQLLIFEKIINRLVSKIFDKKFLFSKKYLY